jgi:hypothetical protein
MVPCYSGAHRSEAVRRRPIWWMSHTLRAARASCQIVAPLAFLAACCAQPSGQEADARFRQLFGSRLSSRVVLVTDKHSYRRDEIISYWVENRTGQAPCFQDQALGVRAFAFDQRSDDWLPVDLGFYVAEPRIVCIQSGAANMLHAGALSVEAIDFPAGGALRLVVIGYLRPASREAADAYVAYTDVVITP